MLDKDDEKYEGPDESEYHFSEEEEVGSYEGEQETTSEEASPAAEQPKAAPSLGEKLGSSRRMVISLVVFLSLVFVVYKMVAPSSTVPGTDITPVMANVATPQPKMKADKVQAMPAPAPAPVVAAQQPIAAPQAPVNQPVVNQPTQMAQQAPSIMPIAAPTPTQPEVVRVVAQAPAAQPVQQAPVPMAAGPSMPQQQPMNAPVNNFAPNSMMAAQPAAMPQQIAPQAPPPMQQAQMQQAPAATPQMQGPNETPAWPAANSGMAPPSSMPAVAVNTSNPPYTAETDARIAAAQAESSRYMNQMQTEYEQKVSDFQNQNHALQQQVETLNSRIATMEVQLSHLVQSLEHPRAQPQSMASPPADVEAAIMETQPSLGQRIAYSVQAIIPGRAWLKSDNGDTVTVAEGDMIKNLGRVTKIDPYDGVVEINTGRKTVSLSYGTGA